MHLRRGLQPLLGEDRAIVTPDRVAQALEMYQDHSKPRARTVAELFRKVQRSVLQRSVLQRSVLQYHVLQHHVLQCSVLQHHVLQHEAVTCILRNVSFHSHAHSMYPAQRFIPLTRSLAEVRA